MPNMTKIAKNRQKSPKIAKKSKICHVSGEGHGGGQSATLVEISSVLDRSRKTVSNQKCSRDEALSHRAPLPVYNIFLPKMAKGAKKISKVAVGQKVPRV